MLRLNHKYLIIVLITTVSVVTNAASPLNFSEACSNEENIRIIAVGDILLHQQLQKQAIRDQKSLRFQSLWSTLIPTLQSADIAYANLEGPTADGVLRSGKIKNDVGFVYDNKVYSEYALFNYHSHLVTDIKASGFDVVSTANNHALDRWSIGADKTIEALRREDLLFTGTKTSLAKSAETWHTVTTVKNRNIAWLACTYSTNGMPDDAGQVLFCFENRKYLLGLVSKLAADPKIDAVIVTPHWGQEYQLVHNKQQTELGRQLLEAGATAVIGTHPHVVQPWEKYITRDGREGFIIYSTGNFVSGQKLIERKTSLMLSLHLTGKPNEKMSIRGVEFAPLLMKITPEQAEVFNVTSLLKNSPQDLPEASVKIWNKNYSHSNLMFLDERLSLENLCKNHMLEIANNNKK